MQLELTIQDANSIGALLKTLNHARLLDENNQPITGKMSVTLNSHLSVVLRLYNRILKAEQGGISQGKIEEPPKEKPKRKRKQKVEGIEEPNGDN